MTTTLAMLAAALAAAPDPAPPAPSDTVEAVEITTRAPIVGDLQKGALNFRPEYFTQVRPSTAMDMITWLPGFTFEDTRDMRGLGGSTGNVLIDGKPPTSKTDTLTSVLRRIPAEQVERVDLIVGGAPGIDMRGRSVIANVVLKVKSTPQRMVSVSNYLDGHGRASPSLAISTSQKKEGKTIEASLDLGRNLAIFPGYGYGSYVRRGGVGVPSFGADTDLLIGGPFATGSGAYEVPFASGRLRLNGSARYYASRLNETNLLQPGPGQYSYHEANTYRQGEVGLRYERSLGRTGLETQILNRFSANTLDQDRRRPPQPTVAAQDSNWREHVGRVVARFKRDDKLTLEASAEGAVNTFENHGALSVDGTPVPLPNADLDVNEHRGEVGAGMTWKPNGEFNLDTALKAESSSLAATGTAGVQRSFTYLKPKATFTWTPDKDTQVRLRAEQEVGQLSFFYFISYQEFSGQFVLGNTALRPPRTWVLEAQFQRRFWNGGDLQLTARRRALKDVVDPALMFTPNGVYNVIGNIGDGNVTDLIANMTLPLKRFGLDRAIIKGVVTHSRARVTDPVTGRERPLSGQPQFLAELHFTQDFPQWSLNWGIDAFYRGSSAFYRPFVTEALAPWPHVNVFLERRFKPAYTLRLEVQNLPGAHTRQRIEVFDGMRNTSPLSYVDEKRLSNGPLLFVRLRRAFE